MIFLKRNILLPLISCNFFMSQFSYAKTEKIKIVTSIPYLSDLVRQTTCHSKAIELNNLIPYGSDPHSFHMTKNERISIENANLVIIIGADFEPWAHKIRKSNKLKWLVVTEGMELKKIADEKQEHSPHNHPHEHEHEHHNHEHNHLEYDPHIWQSPLRTKLAAKKIASELKKLLPAESKIIEGCTKNYINTIDQEVNKLKKQLDTIPINKRKLATNHDALGYFASEFGLTIKSIVGLSDEAAPTAARLKEIINEIKQENINALFLESTGNMRNIKTVSNETGVKIGGTLYSDSLGPKGSEAETTIGMWQINIKTILDSLKI